MGWEGGWSGWVWAARSFCMSVSFHNSSAKRDCQASLWFWRSIRSCLPAITTERWGCYFQIPAGQLASTLFWTRRDDKTISLNQEHLPPSLQPLPLPLPSSEIRCGIKVTLTDITFLSFPSSFCLPNETFPLLQRERFVIVRLHRCEQIAVGCTLTLGPLVVACLFSLSRSKHCLVYLDRNCMDTIKQSPWQL